MKSETIQSLLEAAKTLAEKAEKSEQKSSEEAEKFALAARHLTKAATDVQQVSVTFTESSSSES